ncbi:hypothetical protein [Amycolatopsis sp. NPDC049868]|uniref:hypothetical protein n=1 Tax=Amycolatopsis sp. NPDC049868 TaxID=3363934 RepID=UPI0037B99B5E
MGDITSVDMHAADAATKKLADDTAELSRAIGDVHQELEERSGCWGDDETGEKFEGQYMKPYKELMASLHELKDQLTLNASDIRKVPGEFAAQDEENAAGF